VKAACLALLLACCTAAAAQPWREAIGSEGEQQLRQLRLEKAKRFTLEAPAIHAATRRQLVQSEDRQLMEAALRDQSAHQPDALNEKVQARLQLFHAALAAKSAELDSASPVGEDRLLQLARSSADPAGELRRLRFRFDPQGVRVILPKPGVLIVNPEKNAPDTTLPGVLPPGFPGLPGKPPIWRRGLLYAALIGLPRNNRYELQCSGTVVSTYWLVTAAHCLRDATSGQRLSAQQLAVFLPFQGGSESVTGLQGYANRNLRRVAVEETAWVGEDSGDAFPKDDEGLTAMVNEGKDLALLRLRKADMDALPSPIEAVSLHKGAPSAPPVSMVGYGITTALGVSDLTLMVGVRDALPDGAAELSDLLTFGPAAAQKAGGICGGDSGGGLFAGRISGAPGALPRLIGVASALLASVQSGSAEVCVAHQQGLSSLLSERNRKFVCSRAPSVCG